MATIYKRGAVWWARVQRDGRDFRVSLKTTAEGVARRRLRAWLERAEETKWSGPSHSFDDLALKFIDGHLPSIKPRSAVRYRQSIEALTRTLEGKPLAAITSAALYEFLEARRTDGVKAPTIRRDLACLSSMFSLAMEWEMAEVNPVPGFMRAWKKRGLRESPPRRRWLREAEEMALLAECTGDLLDAVCVAIDTGLRREEQFSLRRAQVNWAANQIDLVTGTKNARQREVPMLPRTAGILKARPIHLGPNRQPVPYVFVNPETKTRYLQLNKGLKAAADRAEIAPITWHDLRRTCGCRLLQRHGMSMEQVSKWLGHSSVLVTERVYAFLETEHLHEHLAAQNPAQDSGAQQEKAGSAKA